MSEKETTLDRKTKIMIQLRNVLIVSKETHEEHNWNIKLLSVDNI